MQRRTQPPYPQLSGASREYQLAYIQAACDAVVAGKRGACLALLKAVTWQGGAVQPGGLVQVACGPDTPRT
jgi:hypothetical protein